jgi:SAM-dependent methyltransferase
MTEPTKANLKVQFGSGPMACADWLNFDCSPTLRIQRLPIIGAFAQRRMTTVFADDVLYGDTRTGLPLEDGSVQYLYCSHVLEHLSLEDFRLSLKDCLRILAPGGVFRAVMPDLEAIVADYGSDDTPGACSRMMENSNLGMPTRPKGVMGGLRTILGNARHLWLWDYKGARAEFEAAGFTGIRRAEFDDSAYPVFKEIEEISRWEGQLGLECFKPG